MPLWRSLNDGPYVAPRPGDTVDLRGTTTRAAVAERKELMFPGFPSSGYLTGGGSGSYNGGYNIVTGIPGRAWTLDRAVRDGYSRVPWCYVAVRVIALSQAGLRFGVKDNDKEIGKGATEIADDPFLPLLNGQSNPLENATQLRERTSTIWMLSPRGGFLELVPGKRDKKRIMEIRLAPAQRTRIVPDASGNIDHFEIDRPGGFGKPRPVAREYMRWFREPHPTDDFAGLTPLEASTLSVEANHFARLYNRQAMANDGRPSGIVAVEAPQGSSEPADEEELDRIERKFGGGPVDAGRLVVVDGTVTYTDTQRSARDMQWKDGLGESKDEIFGVFLVPVSAIDSSDRTFSNSGQEWINYWTLRGVPHGDAFAALFAADVQGVPFLDYSRVAALEAVRAQRRAELRDEVQQGLRTPIAYARETGQTIGDQPGEFPDVPATRSLWRAGSGVIAIAASKEDQEAVDKLSPLGSAPQAAPLQEGAVGDGGTGGGAPAGDPSDPFWQQASHEVPHHPGDTNLASIAVKRAQNARARSRASAGRPRAVGYHGDDDAEDHRAGHAGTALEAALTALAQRQVAVALARASGVKARMGTRHWTPKPGEPLSTKLLDPQQVADPQQWYDQGAQVAQANLEPVVRAQYEQTQSDLENDHGAEELLAVLATAAGAGAAASATVGSVSLAAEIASVVGWLAQSAANHGADLLARIAETERSDAARVAGGGEHRGVQPVLDAIHAWAEKIPGWVQSVAPTSVQQAVEAGKHAVLGPLGDRVEREWRTRGDDKVRSAHAAAQGQVAAGDSPFVVGGEPLRYPRDPKGSPGNVINCRCRSRWRIASASGKKGLDPVAAVLALPAPTVRQRRSDDRCEPLSGPFRGELSRGARVSAAGALTGVAGRDHVAEIFGTVATKDRRTRHVRTAGGAELFHLPIGSPIVGHPHLPGTPHDPPRRDHVAELLHPPSGSGDAPSAATLKKVAEIRERRGITAEESAHWPARATDYYSDDDEYMVLDDQGHEHYGQHGAAGSLVRHVDEHGTTRYLLQQRSAHVQHGNTWSTPGGALHAGESPEKGAAREVGEEIGVDPSKLAPVGTHTADHGGWAYSTAVLDSPEQFGEGEAQGGGWESSGTGWFTADEVDKLPLHPGFAASWAETRSIAEGPGALPDGAPVDEDGAAGDTAKAKAELAAKGQDLLGLIDSGKFENVEAAEKEYARLLHNTRFRFRRARLKAEKAAGAKVEKAVGDDVAQGPPKTTLGDVGQQLLDTPDDVDLDLALAGSSGKQPKALYSIVQLGTAGWKPGANGIASGTLRPGPAGPGAVAGSERWYDKITEDTDEPIPVSNLHVEAGYVVKSGFAVRKDGVAYLVEADPNGDAGMEKARLEQAQKVYAQVLAGIPAEHRGKQRGVALLIGSNPRDGAWAVKYKTPGFKSAATGGLGHTAWWATTPNPATAAHEYGHNFDSTVYGNGLKFGTGSWLSEAQAPVIPGQTMSWGEAGVRDARTQQGWSDDTSALSGRFVETRAGGHAVTAGGMSVSQYGTNSDHEDFAEAVRLYLKDRREGKVGYVQPLSAAAVGKGTDVRFADMWPERAKILDAAFGLQSDYETPFVVQQRTAAADGVLKRLHEIDAAMSAGDGTPAPEPMSTDHVMRRYGLSEKDADAAVAAAYKQRDTEKAISQQAEQAQILADKWAESHPETEVSPELIANTLDLLTDKHGLVTAKAIVAQAKARHGEMLHKLEVAQALEDAKNAVAQAQAELLSLDSLPKEIQTVIRKRRANVKLRAKQKGASPEEAEQVAAAYEAEQIAKEAAKLGITGTVGGMDTPGTAETIGTGESGTSVFVKPVTTNVKNPHQWLKQAGKHKADLAQSQYGGAPQQAKSNIAATLGGMLNNPSDWETFRNYRIAVGVTATSPEPPTWAASTPAERQQFLDRECSMRVQGWAQTSGDSSPAALMMQQAAKDEFGITGPVGVNVANPGLLAGVNADYPKVAAFYRRFLRVMYDNTQAELAAAGIEWVGVYRGMTIPASEDHAKPGEHHVPLQPMSSFATTPGTAKGFASHGFGAGKVPIIMSGTVHRSRIVGTARTGFGCLNESEWVIMALDEGEGSWTVKHK